MRSLRTIRTRVERLASVYPTSDDDPLIVHWKDFCQRCPACDADLAADAEARAVAEASAARAGGGAAQVFYWAETLAPCPRCHARLP